MNSQITNLSTNSNDDNTQISTSNTQNTTLIGDTQTSDHDTIRFTNEGDMPVVEHRDSSLNDLNFSALGSDSQHSIETFLQRPYLIADHAWHSGLVTPLQLNPWQLFRDNPAYSKLQGIYAVDFTYVFRLVTNSQPFTAGLLQMAFTPCEPGNIELLPKVDDLNLLRHTLSGGPSVLHNISTNSVTELRVRYKAPRPILDLNEREYGYLYLHALSDLKGGSNASNCQIRIYMWLEDVRTYGANVRHVRYQGKKMNNGPNFVTTSSQVAESREHEGPISGIANTVGSVARSLTSIPVLADIAGPVSWVADAVGGIATFFGFSKPFDTRAARSVASNPYKEFANGKGNWNAGLKMTVNDDACVEVHTLGADEDDEMAIPKLLEKPNFCETFRWESTALSGTQLWAAAVTPSNFAVLTTATVGGSSYGVQLNTMMSYLANLFGYWRGTVRLTFTVVATKFHSGRLRFVFVPETNATNLEIQDNLTHTYSHILDVRDATTVTIDVPFISTTPWKKTILASTLDSALGQFAVYVENELIVGGDAYTAVDIAVHVSGVDFQFAVPRKNVLDLMNGQNTPTPYVPRVKPKVARLQGLSMGITEEAPAAVNIANTSARDVPDVAHRLAMGDPITSLRTLVKRFDRFAATDGGLSPPPDGNYVVVNTNELSKTEGFTDPTFQDYNDYFRLICALYAFRSGGMRYAIHPPPVGSIALCEHLTDEQLSQVNPNLSVHFMKTNQLHTIATVPIAETCQLETPFYTVFPMLWNTFVSTDKPTFDTYPEVQSLFYMQFAHEKNVSRAIYRSGADDFNCGYIIGAPMLYLGRAPKTPTTKDATTPKKVVDVGRQEVPPRTASFG